MIILEPLLCQCENRRNMYVSELELKITFTMEIEDIFNKLHLILEHWLTIKVQ